MYRSRTLAAAAALLIAAAAHANTATIIGLIGKSVNATRAAEAELDAARSTSARWADVQATFEAVLARHLAVARELRSAFALAQVPPGYDPAQKVAGLSPAQVRSLDPGGFYHSAVQQHRRLNDRLLQLLDGATDIDAGTAHRLRAALNEAAIAAPYVRDRTDL